MATEDALVKFGFTQLEADIYRFLLQESPATGYRISQALKKPAANTYKALITLEEKNGIVTEIGDSKYFRPVPLERLLHRIEQEVSLGVSAVREEFQNKEFRLSPEAIYSLKSRQQALIQLRNLINSATQSLSVVASSYILQECAPNLVAAVNKGVRIHILSRGPFEIIGATVIISSKDLSDSQEHALEAASAVADSQEMIQFSCFKSTDESASGIATSQPGLIRAFHQQIAAQIAFEAIAAKIAEGAGQKRLERAVNLYRSQFEVPSDSSVKR